MSTQQYKYPRGTDVIGIAEPNGQVRAQPGFARLWRGIEDTSGRVAEYKDPNTATVADVVNALIAAGLMKAS